MVGRNTSARIAGRARRPVAQTQMQCGVRAMLCDAYVARWYVWPSLRSAPAALPLRRQERVRADAVPAACNGFQLGRQHRLQRGKRHDTAGAHCPCWRRSRWRRPRGSTVSPPSAELYSAPATSSTNSAETHPPWPCRPGTHPGPGRCCFLPSRLPLSPSPPHGLAPSARLCSEPASGPFRAMHGKIGVGKYLGNLLRGKIKDLEKNSEKCL